MGSNVTPAAIISTCVLLVLVGVIAISRWGGLDFRRPWPNDADAGADTPTNGPAALIAGTLSLSAIVRRVAWYLDVAMLAGMGAGIVGSGAGGRLVMRLLALTSDESARGRLTEAEEVVGAVTLGGTVGFVVFVGLFSGVTTAGLWLLVRRWLPSGRLGVFVFGLVLLVVLSTRLEPLRPDNEDFEIVGPSGVAVGSFIALAFFHTAVLIALIGRISRALPLASARPGVLVAYAPLLLLVVTPPGLVALVVVLVVAVLAARGSALARFWSRRGCLVAGRLALVALTVFALPSFVGDLAEILG